jgi:hypothetical protein
VEPSSRWVIFTAVARAMSVRISTISETANSESRNARSMSPGTKNDARPSPAPVARSWWVDFSMFSPSFIIVQKEPEIKASFAYRPTYFYGGPYEGLWPTRRPAP